MCGICGVFPKQSSSHHSVEKLARMISAMNHRGPDEAGIYIDDHIGLGHARLSIIDLSSGTQPIHNEDRKPSGLFSMGKYLIILNCARIYWKKGMSFIRVQIQRSYYIFMSPMGQPVSKS